MTPHAFRIAPELLGTPLAGPARRGIAMLIDLAAVGVLTAILRSIGGVLLALAFTWVFWRMASRRVDEAGNSRFGRRILQGLAILSLVVAVSQVGDAISGIGRSHGRGGRQLVKVDGDTAAVSTLRSLGLGDLAGGLGDVVSLRAASRSPAEARAAGERFATRLMQAGASGEDVQRALEGLLEGQADSATRQSIIGAAMSRVDSLRRRRSASTDTLLDAWAEAERNGDTAAAAATRDQLADVLTRGRVDRLRSQNEELQKELRRARHTPGILSFLKGTAHDLGIGFGWLALYFTAFPVFWDGRTPGKRLLGIRAVFLSGEKMGWWGSFERFGGYAAGLATGLLGFLQILWDANRQGIHDRIAGTVVIRDGGSGR